MEKLRRKVADQYGDRKMRSVWRCRCKIGTTNATVAFFLEKPEVGKRNECVKETDKDARKAITVLIDDIYEDGFVFCSLF